MNIRVDLNTPIKDGTEVVFRSPVDCSQVTGLIVYYLGESGSTESKEFAFADAHGNNVGDIDHLFAENVAVKVILDVTTGMAFVQNADTNAYLEGRFAETLDKCCTSFAESGSVVVCDPVEDYPLGVVTHIVPAQAGKGDPSPDNVRPIKGFSGVKLWRGGKNLLPYPYTNTTKTDRGVTFTDNGDGSITANGTTTENPIFILNTNYLGGNAAINAMSHPNGSTNGTYAVSHHLYYNAGNGILSINLTPGTYANEIIWPQIEAGSVSTEYEPYRGNDFVIDFGQTVYGGSFDWKTGVLTVDKKCAFYDGSADEEWTLATGGYDASFVRIASDSNNHDNAYTGVICNRLTANSPNVFYGQGTGIYMYSKWVSIRVDTIEQSVEAYRAWLAENPLEVVYPIEPITIQLAPQEVLALSGRNTLYSNTGDTTVTGKADPTTVIEKLTNAIIALGGNV